MPKARPTKDQETLQEALILQGMGLVLHISKNPTAQGLQKVIKRKEERIQADTLLQRPEQNEKPARTMALTPTIAFLAKKTLIKSIGTSTQNKEPTIESSRLYAYPVLLECTGQVKIPIFIRDLCSLHDKSSFKLCRAYSSQC